MKAGTHNHLKVKRLKRLLKLPLYRAVGILETLWLLCIDCCDEGNVGKFTDEEIADYLEWDGDASELVRALSDSGWTDSDTNGRPVVHDWLEHCPEFIRDRIRKRRARDSDLRKQTTYVHDETDKSAESRTNTGHDRDLTVYGNSIQGNSIQSHSIKKRAKKNGFIKPTVQEVQVYCTERGNAVDPETFIAHYESNGWLIGRNKTPMKNWKAAIVTWEKNHPTGASRVPDADDLANWNPVDGGLKNE